MQGPGGTLLRPARPADYAAARALFAASGESIPPLLVSAAEFGDATEAGSVYLALAEGSVIGILAATPLAYDGDRPYTLWIEAVIVHPDWRRHEIGTALYRALGAWAREVGANAALTASNADPAVSTLHRRVGFVPHRDDLLLWRFEE